MNKIAIITDTDASLPMALAAEYGIYLVPINVHFGEECLESCFEINEVELFERVDREQKMPTTSAPTPGKFIEVYQQAFEDGADEVICFCVSSEVSATYGVAQTAREHLADRPITVVDTRNISMGQGFMVLEAAKAARAGASREAVIEAAKSIHACTYTYAALATLKYLAMSGRVGRMAAGMANLLNIRPILTCRDGKLDLLEKVRTRRKAQQRLVERISQDVDGRELEQLAFIHVNALEETHALESQLCEVVSCPADVIRAKFTAGLSVHTGAGMVGIVAVTK
jgi:DegV family protein with EDD domain